MHFFLINIVISSAVISFAAWLSGRNAKLAGFIVALPLSTMLVLLLSHAQYRDPVVSVRLAQSIFATIPLSLLFFVPFLFAEKLGWSFWGQFTSGTMLLVVGYLAHYFVVR